MLSIRIGYLSFLNKDVRVGILIILNWSYSQRADLKVYDYDSLQVKQYTYTRKPDTKVYVCNY